MRFEVDGRRGLGSGLACTHLRLAPTIPEQQGLSAMLVYAFACACGSIIRARAWFGPFCVGTHLRAACICAAAAAASRRVILRELPRSQWRFQRSNSSWLISLVLRGWGHGLAPHISVLGGHPEHPVQAPLCAACDVYGSLLHCGAL